MAALAAVTSVLGQWSAVLALAPISVAIISEVALFAWRPEKRWHRTRFVAESAKTLAWRYQVGGHPLGLQLAQEEADQELLERLTRTLDEFQDIDLPPAHQEQVTKKMRGLRSQPLTDRIRAYREDRINDQRAWYAAKSEWNRRRANLFQIGLVLIELAAFASAIVAALSGSTLAAYSLLSALAIAGVGWLQIKQFRSVANSYSVASHDLAAVSASIDSIKDEKSWEEFVDRAEEAISREHTLWLASKAHLHLRSR